MSEEEYNILTYNVNINGPLKNYNFKMVDIDNRIDENNLITFILFVAQRHGPFDLELKINELKNKFIIYCNINQCKYVSDLYDDINDKMIIDYLMKLRFIRFRLGLKDNSN